jgi:hypothetical protein
MFKNVAGQKIALFAFDTATGKGKAGDAANITAYVNKAYAGAVALTDTSATEIDAVNQKGWYLFDLTQGETDADALLFSGKSVTADIEVVGVLVFTLPAAFTSHVAQTGDSYARIGANGAGLSALPWNAAWDAEVQSEVADALTAHNTATAPDVTAIKAKTDNLPSDPADASDIAASFATVNTKLDTIDDFLDTELPALTTAVADLPTNAELATALGTADDAVLAAIAALNNLSSAGAQAAAAAALAAYGAATAPDVTAIKAKTDNLPSDPADASDIASSFGTVNTNLATVAGYLDTEIAAIKAKTDNLPASPAATGDIPTAAQNADALLGRNQQGGSNTTPTVSQALAGGLMRFTIDTGTGVLTVLHGDGTTAYTRTLTREEQDAIISASA